jgi:hypothetical protein
MDIHFQNTAAEEIMYRCSNGIALRVHEMHGAVCGVRVYGDLRGLMWTNGRERGRLRLCWWTEERISRLTLTQNMDHL